MKLHKPEIAPRLRDSFKTVIGAILFAVTLGFAFVFGAL